MRISAINNFNNNYNIYNQKTKNDINFQSNRRVVTDTIGRVINRNTTCFYREDLDWNSFATLLLKKYENTKKVNVHNFACSDGSETYTLVMSLLENSINPKETKKFFPIKAIDIDKVIINKAKTHICEMIDSDIISILQNTDSKFFKYFEPMNDHKFFVKSPLKDNIKFKQGDILKTLNKLPDENNVIIMRNCWPYIKFQNYDTLIEKLHQKTQNNGLLIIGDFDYCKNIPGYLQSSNFQKTSLNNVFMPVATNDSKL